MYMILNKFFQNLCTIPSSSSRTDEKVLAWVDCCILSIYVLISVNVSVFIIIIIFLHRTQLNPLMLLLLNMATL